MVRIGVLFLLLSLVACGPNGGGNNGNNGTAAKWEEAFDASDKGWLLSVAGSSASDVYAVGGTPDEGRIWHFDGSSWSEQPVPEGVPLLNWVHVFDDGTPIIAGNDGMILRRQAGQWVAESTPTEQDLWGVWGANRDDIWAVGGNGRDENAATIVRLQPDDSWKEIVLPAMERPNVRAFFKVWGTADDNVYIVGQRGAVLHWDGAELGELLVGTSQDLISLWGTGSDNIVIVGGRSNGVVAHYDGAEWTTQSVAPAPGLNGVWMKEPGVAWVAGNNGTLGRLDVDRLTLETDAVSTNLDVHAVFGVGGERFAVGGNFQVPQGPYEGVAVHRSQR